MASGVTAIRAGVSDWGDALWVLDVSSSKGLLVCSVGIKLVTENGLLLNMREPASTEPDPLVWWRLL